MAEHEGSAKNKERDVDQKRHSRQKESEPSFDKFHAWDTEMSSLTETPFEPPMGKHAQLLAMARSDVKRSNLVLHFQRTYGNKYVQRLIESMAVQAKLAVNAPNDVYEQEADRVADAVTKAAKLKALRQEAEEEEEVQMQPVEEEELQAKTSQVQCQEVPEEEEEIQMQQVEEEEEVQAKSASDQPDTVSESIEARINNAKGNGHPLTDNVREPMEQALGADFNDVRVHTDPEANLLNQQLSARAFTTARDIFFRQEEYSPTSDSGRKLIAHELTHVVQQTGNKHSQHSSKEKTNPATATPSASIRDRVSPAGIQHHVVQRKPGGILATANVKEVFAGLKQKGCKLNWGKRNEYFTRLEEAPQNIDDYDKAVIFLFKDKGEQDEAVAKAEDNIREKKGVEKQREEEEEKEKEITGRYGEAAKTGLYFRGDERTLSEITKKGGFTAFNPLRLDDARQQVRKWYGEGGGDPASLHEGWIRSLEGGDKIATGNDINCMGLGAVGLQGAVRNLYRIRVNGLHPVEDVTEEVLGVKPHKKANSGPKLIINAATVEEADVIAVGGTMAKETTFFTSIPFAWIDLIYEVKAEKGKEPQGWKI